MGYNASTAASFVTSVGAVMAEDCVEKPRPVPPAHIPAAFCPPKGFECLLRCQSCGGVNAMKPNVHDYTGFGCGICESDNLQLQIEPRGRVAVPRYTERGEQFISSLALLVVLMFFGGCLRDVLGGVWSGVAAGVGCWIVWMGVDAWARKA